MAGRFSVDAVFKAIDRMSRPIAKMQSRMERFTRTASRRVERLSAATAKIDRGFQRAGLAVVAGGAAMGGALAHVVRTGAEFEQTMISAASKFPGQIRQGTEAFAELERTARMVGGTTEFTASQAAEGLNFLAMAGFNAKQSVAALPGLVNLATAAQLELATASDIATDSLGAFGLMTNDPLQLAKNLGRVNDVLAKTANSANTTVEALFEAIKEGGPVATSTGASIETFAALAGELANAGIKGSVAGTTLKNVFLRLAAPVGESAKALKSMGIATSDAQGNMRGVIDILGDLQKATEGMGTARRAGILEQIFGKIPIAGVNVLLTSGADKLRDFNRQLVAADGYADQVAATMRNSTANDIKNFTSAIESVTLAIFDVVKAPLRDIVQSVTDWTRANEGLIKTRVEETLTKIRKNLPEIVKWAKRIGAGIGAYIAFSAAVKVAHGMLILAEFATKAVAGAKWLYTAATTAATGATWRHVAASIASAGASAKGAAANVIASKSLIGVAKFAGAAAAAIGGIALAWDQWQSLQKESGGLGPLEFMKKAWDMGTLDPAKIVDAHMSEQARAAAKAAKAAPKVDPLASFDFTAAGMAGGDALAKQMMSGLDFSQLGAGGADAFMSSVMAQSQQLEKQLASLPSFRVEHHMMGPAINGLNAGVADGGRPHRPQVVNTTAERIARSIEETRHTEHAEITLRDETGKARVTKPPKGKAISLRLQRTGTP